ncbi:MAG: carbon starvation protein A [Actinomycetia bacterium]|nr:carbon starvation protein A [Actinomycetes bacterium]
MKAIPGVEYVRTSPDKPPVAVIDKRPMPLSKKIIFAVIGLIAASAWAVIAFVRGESVNAAYFVIAAVGTYIIAFRFYARLVEYKIVQPRNDHATPAERHNNGRDFLPTDRRVLFGHHFAAIAGAGPLVGPVLATQMGYLPSVIWIVIGAVLAGAVQDYLVMVLSSRRRGRSLGQMIKDEMGSLGGIVGTIGILFIMVMLIAVLGLIIVQALVGSPWGVFSIACTIPIALFMGLYLRFLRPGRVAEVSVIGVVLLLLAIWGGRAVSQASWGHIFNLTGVQLAWCLIGYGFLASVLPVWLLLAPRDYLSTFMKVGTIVLLAAGVIIAHPIVRAPAVSTFAHRGDGPVFAGNLFPFLFITIACGALSGFHSLISSGTTPKLVEKETQMRAIGYGGMLVESFVAVMALVTAIAMDPQLYFAINAPAAATGALTNLQGATPDALLQAANHAADYVRNTLGIAPPPGVDPITGQALVDEAHSIGEMQVISKTGGAPTLALGMAHIFHSFLGGAAFKEFWYHFAIMFEALFILTTVDAGTRVARFMLSDALGNLPGAFRKFRDPSWVGGTWACSAIVVAGWGSILVMGITDPLGGINTLYPLFGISNQLLAAMALTLVTVVVIKKGLIKWAWIPAIGLVWDLVVTLTASYHKAFSKVQALGYWTQHQCYVAAKSAATSGAITPSDKGVFKYTSTAPKCSVTGTLKQMDAVLRNTMVQEILQILFALCVIIVVGVGIWVAVKTIRAGGTLPTAEEEPVASHLFAPADLAMSNLEKEVKAEWLAYEAENGVKEPALTVAVSDAEAGEDANL